MPLRKRGNFLLSFQLFGLKKTPLWDIETSQWAVNSAGECYLHTVEVAGSIPAPPTNDNKGLGLTLWPLFCCLRPFCCQVCPNELHLLFQPTVGQPKSLRILPFLVS